MLRARSVARVSGDFRSSTREISPREKWVGERFDSFMHAKSLGCRVWEQVVGDDEADWLGFWIHQYNTLQS